MFCEDFETDNAIDFSGEGKEGYSFYANRMKGGLTLSPTEAEMRNSVVYLRPSIVGKTGNISTRSNVRPIGFSMHFGYIEICMRASCPIGRHRHWPKFWGSSVGDSLGENWQETAELVVVELTDPLDKGRSRSRGKDMIYAGVLHDLRRDGDNIVLCSNSVNATGYNDEFVYVDTDWHTYGALWEPGHVAWYMDNKLMHSTRYVGGTLPEYFHRDNPIPLPRIEHLRPDWKSPPWEGAHTVTDRETLAFSLACHPYWVMDVDWVRAWQE